MTSKRVEQFKKSCDDFVKASDTSAKQPKATIVNLPDRVKQVYQLPANENLMKLNNISKFYQWSVIKPI